MTADQIKLLLAKKYANDREIIVFECRNGPKHFAEGSGGMPGDPPPYLRYDAVVLKKSWVYPDLTIFEVKNNLFDYRQDQKWRYALKDCTEFYFVIPHDMLGAEEIKDFKNSHPGAGLMVVAKTGRSLRIKVEAPRRKRKNPSQTRIQNLPLGVLLSMLFDHAKFLTVQNTEEPKK